jgi:hypothetical protein
MSQRGEELAGVQGEVILRGCEELLCLLEARTARINPQGPILLEHAKKVPGPCLSGLELVVVARPVAKCAATMRFAA